MSATSWPYGGLRCRCGYQATDRQALSDHIALARRDAAWNPGARVPHSDAVLRQLWLGVGWMFGADAVCVGLSAAGIPPAPQVGVVLFALLLLGVPVFAVLHLVRTVQEFGHARHRRAAELARFDAQQAIPGYRHIDIDPTATGSS